MDSLAQGFQSCAVPLLLMLASIVAAAVAPISFVLGRNLGLGLGYGALLATLFFVARAGGLKLAVASLFLTTLVPAMVGAVQEGALGSLGPYVRLAVEALAILIFMPLAWGWVKSQVSSMTGNQHESHSLRLQVTQQATILIAIAVGGFILCPASVQFFYWPVIGSLLPWAYSEMKYQEWAIGVAAQGIECNLESQARALTHVEARRQQASVAARDTSRLIQLGVAQGLLTMRGDGYSPDKGLPFHFSADDASTHLAVFGATGTGKTSAVIVPFAQAWSETGNGYVLLDGKGSMPQAFDGAPRFTLIEPGKVQLALIEGLEPHELVTAIQSVSRSNNTSESEAERYFTVQASEMIRHGAVLLQAVVRAEKKIVQQDQDRAWHWTMHDVYDILSRAQRGPDENASAIDNIIALVREQLPEAKQVGLLQDTLEYISITLPGLEDRTRANIWSTAQSWMTPLWSHPELVEWSRAEHGFEVESVLKGAGVGVVLPAFKYGSAGALVQAFVKQRIFTALRLRGQNQEWKKDPAQKTVAMIVDEAQELAGDADEAMLPVARSLGCVCVYSTQHIENYITKFSQSRAEAFLGNFRSFVAFSSTHATGEWVQRKLGTTWNLKFQTGGNGIDYLGSAKMYADSPLADPTHPASKTYQRMLRRGQGSFRVKARDLSIDPIVGGQWVQEPLISLGDWDGNLATPWIAIAQVNRGGVRRRDFIKTTPIFNPTWSQT